MTKAVDPADASRLATHFERNFDRKPDAGAPLALAVSGGPDSMALLALAAAAWPGGVIAATVDHRLRASAADECAMVAAACAGLGVPHATLVADAFPDGASLQAQARHLRYALLIDWAAQAGAMALATAHQADDQAETFLMRAARGAGLSGLAGVRASRKVTASDGRALLLVRPVLDWRRAELRAIVRRAELPFVDDPANDDPRHDRTRFRRLLNEHEWLDAPRIARAAAHLSEADRELRAIADWVWAERARQGRGGTIRIDMAGLPRGLRRRLALRAIGAVRAAAGVDRPDWSPDANIEPLLDALDRGKAATQAGVLARPKGDLWRFGTAPARRTG
ncbi:tRNA lysidine(34) synthetase TilS [Hephaestia mangrovi]|uniref:tRNA lysidine(34) synthetase TilS n=1 Tax=Hephaestia mangrovi TaxID=2873268 RepID=UPI0034E1B0BD